MSDPTKAAEIAKEVISEAHKTAEKVVERAATTAENVLKSAEINQEMVDTISESLRKVFGENTSSKRFIDVSRIPLICQNVDGIHKTLKRIEENMVSKEAFWPIKTIVYGAAGIVLSVVFTALVYLVVQK